jgi:DeoR/GlpR family transcriptional regulator of sugar metabolism
MIVKRTLEILLIIDKRKIGRELVVRYMTVNLLSQVFRDSGGSREVDLSTLLWKRLKMRRIEV